MIINEDDAIVLDTNMVNAFLDGDPIDELDQVLDKAASDLEDSEDTEIYILLKIVAASE